MTTPEDDAAEADASAMPSAHEHGELRVLTAQADSKDYLKAMWQRREFAVALPAEEMRSQHQDTFLGNLWHLGDPLLSVLVYYVVFGIMLKVDRSTENFTVWLTAGVFAYRLTTSSVQGGAKSVVKNRGLMRSIRFPRALLPISKIISDLMSFAFQLVVVALMAVATGEPISARWLALPAIVTLHTTFNLGAAFIAARLNDSYRDVDQLIPFVFRILMYVSGVMFPLEPILERGLPGVVRTVIHYNPIVALLQMYRWVFVGTPVDIAGLSRLVVLSVVLLVFGFRYFRGGEHRYGLQ